LIPFAGSNVVGLVAERFGRRWISIDLAAEYLKGSFFRFEGAKAVNPTLRHFLASQHVKKKSVFVRT